MGLLWCYNELQLNFDKCKLCFFPYTVNLPWNYIITIFLRIYVSKKKFNCQKHTEHVFDFSKVMVWINWVFFFSEYKIETSSLNLLTTEGQRGLCHFIYFFHSFMLSSMINCYGPGEKLYKKGESCCQKVLRKYPALRFLSLKNWRNWRNKPELWIWFFAWALNQCKTV